MPELPEVETWRRLAERHAVGKQIQTVHCKDDRKIFDRNAPASVSRALEGRTVTGTGRSGKHMWMTFDQPGHLYLHFGMTGSLWALKPGEENPSHVKLSITLKNETRLVYRNMRRIGRLRWLDDATAVPPVSELGPDPLLDPLFTVAWIQERLQKKRTPIKAALLDQSLFAGVGNWIADEVLYQSRLAPSLPCESLSKRQMEKLHSSLLLILHTAVDAEADSDRFPRDWLFHYRWRKKAKTDSNGNPIQFDQVGGRTTAWVPKAQA